MGLKLGLGDIGCNPLDMAGTGNLKTTGLRDAHSGAAILYPFPSFSVFLFEYTSSSLHLENICLKEGEVRRVLSFSQGRSQAKIAVGISRPTNVMLLLLEVYWLPMLSFLKSWMGRV